MCGMSRQEESTWGHENKAAFKPLSLPKRVLNFVHDEPARTLAYMGIPLAGSILLRNLSQPALTLSQRLMHTRVQAQSSVLIILGLTISLNAFMISRGRFPEPDEDISELNEDAKAGSQ